MKNTTFTLTKRALWAALLVLLLGAAGTVNAQTFTVGNLNYSVNEGTQTVTVTGHVDGTSASGSLTIPESVDYGDTNYAVTAIGDEAFKGCSGFTGSLIIPNSVTTIGRYAFYNCGGFNGTLTLGDAVTTIGNYAFTYCSNFTGNLIIPDALTTIGSYAFLYCSNLTGSLVIPNSVTTIGEGAFVNCSGFTGDLVIPDAVITIGRQTFDQCTGFTGNLIIGNHVETIGIYAFDGCTGFTGSLVIPNSVTTIGIMAFRNCFNFDGSLILGDAVETILDKAFEGCTGFSSIESLAVMPPTLGADVFNGWNASTPVYVPCGSGPDYSGWGGFSNIIDLCTIYVKDVMLLGGSESEVNALLPDRLAEGWHLINKDLNAGCGSGTDYIYLLYKSEATEGVNLNYVTGFYISNAGGTAPNSLTYNDRTYYLVPYDGGNHFKSKKGDLNSNAGGDDIHLYYTKDVFSDNRVVTEITFNATQSGALGVNGGTTGYDLNSGASGDYIYMHVTKEVALVDPEFAITTSATPSGGGTLSGAGTYHYGDSCTLTATPTAGYAFLSWTKNGTQVSTNPNYTFTVTGNRTFVAQFQEQNYTINVSASPTDGGTVSGAGIYGINTTCTLTATANTGYVFVNWTQGTATVTTEATFSFTVMQDSTFVANFEQVPDLTTQPDTLDLGYRPAGAWMRPYQFTLTNNKTQTTISMIDFTPSNGLLSFDLGELDLPFVLDQNESATIGLAWGDQPGSMDGSMVVIYSSAEATRSAEVFPVEAEIYVPALGDVWETAKEVNTFPYTDTVNADTLYSNYVLPYPNIPNGSDVVYRLEFDHDVLLNADLVGSNGKLALYAEGFEDFGGPDLDNYLSVSPEPKDFWFNYNYTSNNTWYGVLNGSGLWFGYKIPAEFLAGFGQCYITAVEAAAHESYPYNLYVFKGGETPNEATMVYSQEMTENPEAMQFFIMDINTPFAIGETEDVWVIFYSDSPFPAYSGKGPEDPTNAKIWYSENGTTWNSNEFCTPEIHVHLQYPKPVGRGEVVLNLADMSMSPAQSMANDRGASTYLIEGLHVPAGTYYLVASSTSDTFSVSIDTMRFPYPPTHLSSLEKGVLYDGEDLHLIWDEPEGNTPVTLYRVYKWDEWNHDFFFHGNADTNEYDQAGLVYGDDGSDYTSYYYKVSAWYAADSLESALTDAYEVRVYPSSTVSGHVLEQDSVTGIADATVNFMAGERVFSGTTDANGAYSVTLPATSYDYGKVWATAAVHDSICYDSTLTVPTGLLEDVDFILRGTSPKDLYISRTGFAMWDNGVEGQRQYLKSLVTLTDMEGDTLFTGETNKSYRQLPTDSLTDGAFYRCLVAHVYTTGPSNTTSQTWFYQSCDHFDGAIDPEGVVDSIGVHLSWGYPEADTTGNMNPANWYYYDDGNYYGIVSVIYVQAVMFPAGTYQGNVLTKIAYFDANSLNGMGATVTVYNDGENAPDNPVGNLTFTHTGTHQFVEFEFPEPIVIDTTKNLWVLVDVDGHKVACALNHAGGPNNGNWGIGANGVWGHPLYAPTWMIRAQMVKPALVKDPLGANIYRDGEWIGFTADSTFLDASGTYNNEYALRVVYDGDSICPNANAYYAMSCPQVVPLASQQLQITVAANPSAGGTVSGAGYYDSGTTVTLTATANEDYVFTSWTKNGQQVSDSPSYSFTVTASALYVANFSQISYAIMATAEPSEGGTVTGSGVYTHGATATLTATANEHYSFVNWTENDSIVSTSATYSFTVTNAGNYVAHFEIDSYVITATANPIAGGEVTGAGTYNHGETATLTATANEGYSFVNWTENDSIVSTNATYSFAVTEAGAYVAHFSLNEYEITATADPSVGGTVSGAGTYTHGATATLTATANEGYSFVNWTKGNEVVSTTTTCSITVTEAGAYVAHFEANDYEITATANPTVGGEVSGAGTYAYGTTCTLTATAAENFGFVNWTKGDEVVSTTATFSFTVSGDAGYVANFELLPAVTQTTHFVEGWTWWSTYLEQSDVTGLNQLETGLGTNGLLIKAQNASVVNIGDAWYGTLEALDNESSYRIKANAAVDVTLTGAPVATAEHPITLRPNWTWMGYPCVTAMGVEEALSGIEPQEQDVVKTQDAMAVYLSGAWYGPLNTLVPGMGLMYLSNGSEDMTLTLPTLGKGGELRPNLTAEHNHWQPNLSAYPDNMTVIAVVELDEEPEVLEPVEGPTQELQSEHYELSAFANGTCRGSVKLLYVEPIQRYIAFLTVTGDEAAELRFGLYDAETGDEYHNAEETLSFASNAVVGSLDEPYVIRFRGNTGLDDLNNRIQVFPNPVGKGQTFNIGMTDAEIGEAQVEIINALGVVVETVCTPSLQAPNVPGVYTLRITVEGQGMCYRKLIVR